MGSKDLCERRQLRIGLHVLIVHSPECIIERKDSRMDFNKYDWLEKWIAES